MSKIIAASAISGAREITKQAEEFLHKAIREKGESQRIEFPETAYFLPMANALLGIEARTLGDVRPILEHAKSLLPEVPRDKLWLPYLGDALDAGIATMLAEEIICALRYLYGTEPQADCIGFYTDTWQRKYGIQLVDGRMPGFAAILGAAPDNKIAVDIVREFQKRNIICFVGSSVNGRSIIDQLKEEKVEMSWETYIVPFGRDTISAIYPLNWAIRSALTFGGLKAGQAKKCLLYTKERVFAFGLVLGFVDNLKYATGAGAINMGFPIIADTDIPEIKPSGITTYEAVVKEFDYKKIVPRCIEVRGVKVKLASIPIPVPYAAAFEGERVRKEQLHVEFGGKASLAFEYLSIRKSEEIEDGRVELFGPDIDQLKEGKKSMPLAIIIEVSGRKMQKDFEPILERQIHRFINYAMGLMHIGQRDMSWIRISQDAFNKGFRLKHIGVILHAMFHQEYGGIIDKLQVKLYTEQPDAEELLKEAKAIFDERDERIIGMTDESVDTFYSCLLCQSFAPNHVCVVTPERLGLCGSISWLDAKASYEINPTGPNQPIIKGEFLDERLGQWKSTNDFVYQRSNKIVEKVNMYSLMDSPQTSCVVSDTQVVIDNEVLNIGDFIDKHRGGEDYAKSQVLTLSKEKSVSEKIVAMQRFELPKNKNKLFKVATKSGSEIILTPKHKLAIDKPEGLKWIKAMHLKKGDRVISLKKLDIEERMPDIHNFIPENFSAPVECSQLIKKELFYLMGLIASDGSVFRRGNYEYNIYFINTSKELIDEYEKIYRAIFPQKNLHIGIKKPSKRSFIRGRRINSTKDCYVCYSNNSVFGILLDYFGVIPKKENQCFRNLLSLPKEYIANFLSGLFDGDGSVRIRKYKNIWDIAEAYFCTQAKRSADYLGWLLKRFGILSNVRKSSSIYKIEMHGNNIYELSKIIKPVHKTKAEIMKKVQSVYSKKKLDKTQSQVLPFSAAKILTNLSESRAVLSPTTHFYYKTFRSRPVLGNIEKVMATLRPKEAKPLKSLLDSDFYLDIVREVREVRSDARFVYNLTLSDNHCYFANQMLIKNCGCFECIVAIIPEANGFMIVNRDYAGMTPCGMTFTTLAGSVGGGVQTPGFLGVGKLYIVSKKFISAEGGLKRIVWMPKELKELLLDKLKQRANEIGEPDLVDKIADETQGTTSEELLTFLTKVKHPALEMPALL